MADRTPGQQALEARIAAALGSPVTARRRLQGGSTVSVDRVRLADGRIVVVKHGRGRLPDHLAIERSMLDDLAREGTLPVPAVLHGEDDLLVMSHIQGDTNPIGPRSGDRDAVEEHAATLLARLHGTPRSAFGYDRDTVIGQLPQPNPRSESWIAFYRDHRLLHMAVEGRREGTVSAALCERLERLAGRLERYLREPPHPALLHGDIWGGNVITRNGRITGLIDPALYWGDPEVELAFISLFSTFGRRFFDRYAELAPFDPDFFEIRRDIYLIYPLLVHVRYWDTSYAAPIEGVLARLGL